MTENVFMFKRGDLDRMLSLPSYFLVSRSSVLLLEDIDGISIFHI